LHAAGQIRVNYKTLKHWLHWCSTKFIWRSRAFRGNICNESSLPQSFRSTISTL